ncbi:MAG: NRDE family protein [Leptospiraceae bacterium]|nr:NRDE family protein [Leptospiraceae bacterium]
MCTALIFRDLQNSEFGLGFNRDESFLRRKGEKPHLYEVNGIKILMPLDGDHKGTWIGVNDVGDVYALLNLYEVKIVSIAKPISRGLLVRNLLERKNSILDLNAEFLKDFLPFRLIFFSFEKTHLFTWDGKVLQHDIDAGNWKVFASSALHGKEAEKVRQETFEKNFLTRYNQNFLEISQLYLTCHIPEKGSLSPCMHRDVAHTVSQTIIHIQNKTVNLYYKDGQPCEEKEWTRYPFSLK